MGWREVNSRIAVKSPPSQTGFWLMAATRGCFHERQWPFRNAGQCTAIARWVRRARLVRRYPRPVVFGARVLVAVRQGSWMMIVHTLTLTWSLDSSHATVTSQRAIAGVNFIGCIRSCLRHGILYHIIGCSLLLLPVSCPYVHTQQGPDT